MGGSVEMPVDPPKAQHDPIRKSAAGTNRQSARSVGIPTYVLSPIVWPPRRMARRPQQCRRVQARTLVEANRERFLRDARNCPISPCCDRDQVSAGVIVAP